MALVLAVGQIEVPFSLVASALVFRERIAARGAGGIALLTGSVLALIPPGPAAAAGP